MKIEKGKWYLIREPDYPRPMRRAQCIEVFSEKQYKGAYFKVYIPFWFGWKIVSDDVYTEIENPRLFARIGRLFMEEE